MLYTISQSSHDIASILVVAALSREVVGVRNCRTRRTLLRNTRRCDAAHGSLVQPVYLEPNVVCFPNCHCLQASEWQVYELHLQAVPGSGMTGSATFVAVRSTFRNYFYARNAAVLIQVCTTVAPLHSLETGARAYACV